MNIEPADIVGIPFPYTDMSANKRRPVLALTHPQKRGLTPFPFRWPQPQHTMASL